MECKQAQVLLHAYGDGELDLAHSLEIETHLRGCPACSNLVERQQALRSMVRESAEYHRAPDHLRRRVLSALREQAPAEDRRRPFWASLWLAPVAAVFLALAGWSIWTILSTPPKEQLLAQQILDRHLGSLQAAHLTDVPSSDHHTVKPWFAGKLDFSPPVADFPDQSFVLAGGRLDQVNGRPVAVLVYKRREHVINLFVWPADPASVIAPRAFDLKGYHLFSWVQSGMAYWAASDLNSKELAEFVGRLREGP